MNQMYCCTQNTLSTICVKDEKDDRLDVHVVSFSREEGHTSLLLEVSNHTAPDGQVIQVDKVVKYFWKKVPTHFVSAFSVTVTI